MNPLKPDSWPLADTVDKFYYFRTACATEISTDE